MILLQFVFQNTTSSTLARMSEITITLGRDECSVRSIADEPRCEFPVVPDRLVGEISALHISIACMIMNSMNCCSMVKEPASRLMSNHLLMSESSMYIY